ncbi:hypothetical protein LEP1GSC061_3856 [Leptospira wolffii serovar Khorat str. Khorat-H2]|nr:hypothetical protein LEP1GSC061_3856 [Leptospira wolffii serovar Khorat str. Khorat-H2]
MEVKVVGVSVVEAPEQLLPEGEPFSSNAAEERSDPPELSQAQRLRVKITIAIK